MTAIPLRSVASLCALALVAACGGTSVPLVPTSPAFPGDNLLPGGGNGDTLSLSEIQTVSRNLAPGYNAAGITPKTAVPTSGSANYVGYVVGDLTAAGRVPVNGLMEMGVNFGNNRVGGTVGNFVTADGDDIDGILTVRDGRLNRTLNSRQVTIQGDVDGRLRAGSTDILVDGRITDGNGRGGGFKGTNGEYIGIPMRGDILANGQRGSFALDGVLGRQSR